MVMLSLCPEGRKWDIRLRLPQDQDWRMILKVHARIAGRPGGQRHRVERPYSVLGSNIDRDDDLVATPLRSTEIEGVVPADRWGQMIATTELHKRASLAIIGSKDAGHPLLIA